MAGGYNEREKGRGEIERKCYVFTSSIEENKFTVCICALHTHLYLLFFLNPQEIRYTSCKLGVFTDDRTIRF